MWARRKTWKSACRVIFEPRASRRNSTRCVIVFDSLKWLWPTRKVKRCCWKASLSSGIDPATIFVCATIKVIPIFSSRHISLFRVWPFTVVPGKSKGVISGLIPVPGRCAKVWSHCRRCFLCGSVRILISRIGPDLVCSIRSIDVRHRASIWWKPPIINRMSIIRWCFLRARDAG